MMNLTPEDREIGRENYYEAIGHYDDKFTRRGFFKGSIAAGLTSGAGLGAMYFGYDKTVGGSGDPVRVGVIGTGDEGNILIGAINPDYVQVVAISDIRPSSLHRAFYGDWGGSKPAYTHSLRPGLLQKYGWKTIDEAKKTVQVYDGGDSGGYQELIQNPDVEAVIIALPLHLHAGAAIAAMKAGKHVLTEKLMAHNVAQCKLMARVAGEKGVHLATGHQRHYSVLYDNAVHLLKWGLLGEIHHIRAQWHRGNLPGSDSWAPPIPGGEDGIVKGEKKRIDKIASQLNSFKKSFGEENVDPKEKDLLEKRIAQWTQWDLDKTLDAVKHDYESITLPNGRERSALEELVRWRLWDRTGGGLMAELGSHQLDAASIFISAMRSDGKKSHPLSVHAVGGRHIFPLDRDAGDHVYCMYEFPGPGYDLDFDPGYVDPVSALYAAEEGIPAFDRDENKKIVVTYSSINGNGFGGYGEVVMGTKGTLILEKEEEVMVYKGASTSSKVAIKDGGDGAVLDTQASGGAAPVAKAAENVGPISRGYTEEIEHWAWCIRNPAPENKPRCYPEVALGDAVIALATKVAIDRSNAGEGGYLKFEETWYDIDSDDTPDGSSIEAERQRLGVT
jgi:predicted dehydrogenase